MAPVLDVAGTAGAEVRSIDDRILVACGLASGAGLIHLVAAAEHLEEYALFSVFFVALALAQLAWGVAVYRSPRPRLMFLGAVVSVLVVVLWIASRTVGLPIGPERWSPESVGAIDSIASADELVLALLVMFQLQAPIVRPAAIAGRRIVTAAGLWLILFSSLALVAGGHAN